VASPTPIAKKLQIKPGTRVTIHGAPKEALAVITPLPDGASMVKSGADVAVHFVKWSRDIEPLAAKPQALAPITWLAYPKKTSGLESDLTRDAGWDPLFARGFIGISSIAIDETWSAIRIRQGTDEERARAAKLREGMRRPGEKRTAKKPPAKLPADLAKAIGKSAAAKKTSATLAPSHVREYADWIESAKKPETRAARIAKAVEMLAAGQRDRNAKYR
jgi:hypothetical protein